MLSAQSTVGTLNESTVPKWPAPTVVRLIEDSAYSGYRITVPITHVYTLEIDLTDEVRQAFKEEMNEDVSADDFSELKEEIFTREELHTACERTANHVMGTISAKDVLADMKASVKDSNMVSEVGKSLQQAFAQFASPIELGMVHKADQIARFSLGDTNDQGGAEIIGHYPFETEDRGSTIVEVRFTTSTAAPKSRLQYRSVEGSHGKVTLLGVPVEI
jgi:hypothetical protein